MPRKVELSIEEMIARLKRDLGANWYRLVVVDRHDGVAIYATRPPRALFIDFDTIPPEHREEVQAAITEHFPVEVVDSADDWR